MRKNPEHEKENAFESIIHCCCFFFIFFFRLSVSQSDYFLSVHSVRIIYFFSISSRRYVSKIKLKRSVKRSDWFISICSLKHPIQINYLVNVRVKSYLCYFSWRTDDFRFRNLLFWPLSVGWCCYFQCVVRSIVIDIWQCGNCCMIGNWKWLCCQWYKQSMNNDPAIVYHYYLFGQAEKSAQSMAHFLDAFL